jgi:hypothetical protein
MGRFLKVRSSISPLIIAAVLSSLTQSCVTETELNPIHSIRTPLEGSYFQFAQRRYDGRGILLDSVDYTHVVGQSCVVKGVPASRMLQVYRGDSSVYYRSFPGFGIACYAQQTAGDTVWECIEWGQRISGPTVDTFRYSNSELDIVSTRCLGEELLVVRGRPIVTFKIASQSVRLSQNAGFKTDTLHRDTMWYASAFGFTVKGRLSFLNEGTLNEVTTYVLTDYDYR